jgi:molybdenum cofactor synthesis domain-containing protein
MTTAYDKYGEADGCTMDAAIIVVGDEVLQGFIQDTNTPFLASRLRELGHRVRRVTVVPDETDAIAGAVKEALSSDVGLLLVSGGLGTTPDDVTTEAVAKALGLRLRLDKDALAWIEERVRTRWDPEKQRRTDPEALRRMAMLPEGAAALKNEAGMAPGIHLRHGSTDIVLMPGVPAELMDLFLNRIEGAIVPRADDGERFIELTVRMNETAMHGLLQRLHDEHRDVMVGSYPQKRGLVILRVHGKDSAAIENVVAILRKELGDAIDRGPAP